MLKAILFDCDGVIADTEPVHFDLFQKVLAGEGITISSDEYYREYVGMTDRECFQSVFSKAGRNLWPEDLELLMQRKHSLIEDVLSKNLVSYPAVIELIRTAGKKYPLAVVSGALRAEIELICDALQIRKAFKVIVSAEDIKKGKPDPEGYLIGAKLLGIPAHQCVGIEDTPAGIAAVRGAGMKCIAIANVLESKDLMGADRIYGKDEKILLSHLEALVLSTAKNHRLA